MLLPVDDSRASVPTESGGALGGGGDGGAGGVGVGEGGGICGEGGGGGDGSGGGGDGGGGNGGGGGERRRGASATATTVAVYEGVVRRVLAAAGEASAAAREVIALDVGLAVGRLITQLDLLILESLVKPC